MPYYLRILANVNYFIAALSLLAGLLALGSGVLLGLGVLGGGGGGMAMPSAWEGLVAVVLALGVAGVYGWTGRLVKQGRGRVLQTVVALLSVGSCLGTIYTIYALWVCWVHEDTKRAFETG